MKHVWEIWRVLVVILAAFVIAILAIPVAQSDPKSVCGPFSVIDEVLREEFSEKPVWRGLDEYGRLVVLYEGFRGTWTIMVAMPGGYTCAISVGNGSEFYGAITGTAA